MCTTHSTIVCDVVMPTGPFGERDDQQVFIQKVIPMTNKLFVRLSSTGKRYAVCVCVCVCVCVLWCVLCVGVCVCVFLLHGGKGGVISTRCVSQPRRAPSPSPSSQRLSYPCDKQRSGGRGSMTAYRVPAAPRGRHKSWC